MTHERPTPSRSPGPHSLAGNPAGNRPKALRPGSDRSFIIRYLSERQGEVVYPKDIERRFNLTHPTVSGLLQRLESKGFLSCEPDPDDRRYKRIVLTEKAAECQKEIWQHILTIEQTMTAGMQESEIDTLVRLLDLAAKNLDVCVDFDCIKEECKP